MPIADASSGYNILKHDKKSSYVTKFACQLGRYRFTRIPLGVVPEGDISVKFDKVFKGLPNVFGIVDDILILGYDSDSRP